MPFDSRKHYAQLFMSLYKVLDDKLFHHSYTFCSEEIGFSLR
jgi:hypothetical protein